MYIILLERERVPKDAINRLRVFDNDKYTRWIAINDFLSFIEKGFYDLIRFEFVLIKFVSIKHEGSLKCQGVLLSSRGGLL